MYRMYGIRGCMDAKERACTGFAVAWMQKSVHVQDVRYSRLHGCKRACMYRMYGIRDCMDAKERACTGCTVFAVAWMQKSVNVQHVSLVFTFQ